MILPLMDGISGFRKMPMTWVLVVFNICVFLVLSAQTTLYNEQMKPYFSDASFIEAQGLIYSYYLLNADRSPSSLLKHQAERSLDGDLDAQLLLGSRLMAQEAHLIEDMEASKAVRDKVLLESWRPGFASFQDLRSSHPNHAMGYNSERGLHATLLTYQFTHSGWMHLLFNMFFLLVFGRVTEPLLGPGLFLLFYLLCGVIAAQSFLIFQWESNSLPLVGASGAIGGLIGLSLALFGTRSTKFFYYFGVMKMPFWVWALYFWILADLTGWWKTLPEFSSGVAHSAHIGGTLAGLLLGLALKPFVNFDSEPLGPDSPFTVRR